MNTYSSMGEAEGAAMAHNARMAADLARLTTVRAETTPEPSAMSVPLSDTRLTEIRERKAAATGGGRWILLAGRTVDEYRVKAVVGEDEVVVGVLDFGAGPAARDDKTFIVNAGRDVTALLAEIDRLRAESENRRQAAAANAASVEVLQRQIEKQATELDRLSARLNRAEAQVRAAETVKCWTNEDGRRFVFAEDLAAALGYTPTTPTAPTA